MHGIAPVEGYVERNISIVQTVVDTGHKEPPTRTSQSRRELMLEMPSGVGTRAMGKQIVDVLRKEDRINSGPGVRVPE